MARTLRSSWKRCSARTQVGPKLRSYPVSKITKQAVQNFVGAVQRESGSAWVTDHALRLLRKLLMEAVDAEVIVRNPAARVRLPKKPKRPSVLTPEEIGALAREVPPQWRALILVNAYGALRWSEAAGLTLAGVDWERGCIAITDTIVEVAGHIHREATKTDAGRRRITLPRFVMEGLADHVATWPGGEGGLIFMTATDNQCVARRSIGRGETPARVRACPGSRCGTCDTPGRRSPSPAVRTCNT